MKIQNGRCKREFQKSVLYRGKQIISLREMSIYRLLIRRLRRHLPSKGKAHEETQLPAKPQFCILHFEFCIQKHLCGKGHFSSFPAIFGCSRPSAGQGITCWYCPRRKHRSRCRCLRRYHPCWDHSRRPCWGRPGGWPGRRASRRACRRPFPELRCRP